MATAEIVATIDSYMEGITYPNGNYGSSGSIILGVAYAGEDKAFLWRAIGNFDVSSLSGATINNAKLVRNITSVSVGGFAAKLSRCTRPSTWTEAGVTWNKYDGSNSWTSAGGDYDDTTPGVVNYTEASSTGTDEISGLASYVTDALSNRGGIVSIILRCSDEDPGSTVQVVCDSSEASGDGDWYLEVDYTPAAGGDNLRKALGQVV